MSSVIMLVVALLALLGVGVLLNAFPPFEDPDRKHPGCDCPRCAS